MLVVPEAGRRPPAWSSNERDRGRRTALLPRRPPGTARSFLWCASGRALRCGVAQTGFGREGAGAWPRCWRLKAGGYWPGTGAMDRQPTDRQTHAVRPGDRAVAGAGPGRSRLTWLCAPGGARSPSATSPPPDARTAWPDGAGGQAEHQVGGCASRPIRRRSPATRRGGAGAARTARAPNLTWPFDDGGPGGGPGGRRRADEPSPPRRAPLFRPECGASRQAIVNAMDTDTAGKQEPRPPPWIAPAAVYVTEPEQA